MTDYRAMPTYELKDEVMYLRLKSRSRAFKLADRVRYRDKLRQAEVALSERTEFGNGD